MRERLLEDLSDLDGVEWVALIGPEALPISLAPRTNQAESAAAMWLDLETRAEVLLGGIPERFTLHSESAIMMSHRINQDYVVLMRTATDVNLGALRLSLAEVAERIEPLI